MPSTSPLRRVLLGAAALVLSAAPTAVYAQSNNVINACVNKTSGALRIVSPTAKTCANNEDSLSWNVQGPAGPAFPITCPADSVLVGTTCVDTYEASVWEIPSGSTALIAKVKNGTAARAELQAGGFQRRATADNYTCHDNGNDCTALYAASVPGVTPSSRVTWFQAQQFCRTAGKRLLTNAE